MGYRVLWRFHSKTGLPRDTPKMAHFGVPARDPTRGQLLRGAPAVHGICLIYIGEGGCPGPPKWPILGVLGVSALYLGLGLGITTDSVETRP